MAVELSTFDQAQDFLACAGQMLYAHETVNNLILGVSERLDKDPTAYENPFFAVVRINNGDVILAAAMTPPHNLILAGIDQVETGFLPLIEHLQSRRTLIPGVIAQSQIADQFMDAWKKHVGQEGEVNMRMRVYELRHVQMPPLPPGIFRLAIKQDIPTIAKWLQAFTLEALGESVDPDLQRAEKFVTSSKVFIWERDGAIVSMAMQTRPIAHSVSVSGVYTPPKHRRQGYAGALVAHLSQHLLDQGFRFVNLFTDLDNPTSNKIYQEVGYHPVCDFRSYRFIEA